MTLIKDIRRIGNSLGIIIPMDILRMKNLSIGDKVIINTSHDEIILKKVEKINDKDKTNGSDR